MITISCTVRNNLFPVISHALRFSRDGRKVQLMTHRPQTHSTASLLLFAACVAVPARLAAGPPPQASVGFDSYINQVEARLTQQHRSAHAFLGQSVSDDARLRHGDLIVEQIPAAAAVPGAMIHHWRGAAFAPGATAADFERLLRDIDAYPRHFAPQVERATVLGQRDGRSDGRIQATLRVRQRHAITVVLDTTYDIAFGRLDARHGWVASRSTRIAEIDSPGTRSERSLSATEEHGFLWRLNTYWSYEERDGGLYIEIESVSLTRSIPPGLAWAVRPFVESVPRDSLEFTLRSARNALHK